ncbi:Uncharacterised protein [Candidatus Tiddalikarchaeum anstoanum]|nr:Uncharacterised protein [Candidatus Tiddalikarchaeum anstoanum]
MDFLNDSIPVALEQALAYGSVATLPQLIAAKALADKNNYLWQNKFFNALGEEVIGTYNGKEYLVTIHGAGVLTPARIRQAINDELISSGSAKLTQDEFNNLLEEKIVKVYTYEKDIPNPFGHYAIKMPLKIAKKLKSEYQEKSKFINNPLVIARNGGRQNLENYFDKAQLFYKAECKRDINKGMVGNLHWLWLKEEDASIPHARLLSLTYYKNDCWNSISCLHSNNLYSKGCFIGIKSNS